MNSSDQPVAEIDAHLEAMLAHGEHEPAPVRRQPPRFDVSTLAAAADQVATRRATHRPAGAAGPARPCWWRSSSCGTTPSSRSG